MSAIWEQLSECSRSLGQPLDEVARHHVLEGVLRRLARLPNAGDFVLRGSMLTRAWIAPRRRVADDVDFVGTFPYAVDGTARRFAALMATVEVEDGVHFSVESFRARAMWTNTEFPGVRLFVRADCGGVAWMLQIDVGFNDPLVPPAQRMEYAMLLGPPATVWTIRPETSIAWKLHGLAEMGPQGWRPKDLHDLFLLVESVSLDEEALPSALEAAFVSRGYRLSDAAVFTAPEWWELKSARVKWREYRRNHPADDGTDDLHAVVRRIHERLHSALRALGVSIDKRERL